MQTLDVVVAHLGSDVAVRIDLRLAIGAVAGIGAVLVLSPLVLVSPVVRNVVERTIDDLLPQDPADISVTNQAAFLVLAGLILGALFELVVLVLEQLRPVIVIFVGSITLTDLVAVTVVASVLYRRIRRALLNTRDAPQPIDPGLVFALSAVYGFVTLALLSVLHAVVLVSS